VTPEKAATLAANLLIRAFKDTSPDDGSISVIHEPHTARRGPSEQVYILKSDGLTAIKKAARKLVPLLDSYPLEKCIDRLTQAVIDVKDSGTPLPSAHDQIQARVLEFLHTLEQQGDWEIVFAVRAIDLKGSEFSVGRCHFYVMDDTQFVRWGQRGATGQYDPPANAPLSKMWANQEGVVRGQVVSAARVRAADADHARAKGRSRIEQAIHLLQYGQLILGLSDWPFAEIGLWAQQFSHEHSFCIRLDQPDFVTNVIMAGPIGIDFSISSKAPAWKELEQILHLELSDRNEMQLRLTTALEWIGEAAHAPSAPTRLVALVTAFEALLIEESESIGKKRKLAQRISTLIGQSENDRQAIAKQVEELYEIRCDCVHAGLLDVEKEAHQRAASFFGRTLKSLLCHSPYSGLQNLTDVLREIDRQATA
jgi:hypothetical protein